MSAANDGDGLVFRPLAESGLLVEFDDAIDLAITTRVMAVVAAIDAAMLPGLLDVVPSYRTILLSFDPLRTVGETIAAEVRRWAVRSAATETPPAREVTIPVAYGGEHGPDLAGVAAHTGLAAADVIARHAAADYVVACMGFAPGFAFLVGLPPELATPRRSNPRIRVPAGSVGIGGAQTGVYPLATPGGWHLIGRTPSRLFDLDRAEPFLLGPGDRVRFRAIAEEEYDAITPAPGEQDPELSRRSPLKGPGAVGLAPVPPHADG
jgi:KipI family sensor histidine kinase inhibitor